MSFASSLVEACFSELIIIIKGLLLRRACLQPATNTQNSKPRPPTTIARSKGKLELVAFYCYYYCNVMIRYRIVIRSHHI